MTSELYLFNFGSREKLPEKILQTSEKAFPSSISTSPPSGRTGVHSEPCQRSYLLISNNMCIDIEQDHDRKFACVQTYWDSLLRDCVGAGGQRDFSEDCEGFGGRQSKGPGEANGDSVEKEMSENVKTVERDGELRKYNGMEE